MKNSSPIHTDKPSLEKTDSWNDPDLLDQLASKFGKEKVPDSIPPRCKPEVKDIPQVIGRYPVKRWIGSGASGNVYLGIHPGLKREVAIKVINLKIGVSREASIKRFREEALITDKLNHPNIIRVYDVGEDKILGFYIVMEYVEGGDVGKLLKETEGLELDFAVTIVKGVASALVEAEKLNLVHRDIKPQNIMLTGDKHIKLADLGLAKFIDADNDMSVSFHPRGTPIYMAPEQIRDAKHVDSRADIYALGATFYELVTGKRPFDGKDFYEIFKSKAESGRFKKPNQVKPGLDPGISTVICKMMAFQPKDRYPSATELLKALEAYQVRPKTKRPLTRRSIFLLILLTLISTFALWGYRHHIVNVARPTNLDWQLMVNKVATLAESKRQTLSNDFLPQTLEEDRGDIDEILGKGKNYLVKKDFVKASASYFEAIKLMRKLRNSVSTYAMCVDSQSRLKNIKKEMTSLFPKLKQTREWEQTQNIENDATVQFNANQWNDGLKLYQTAITSYQKLCNHFFHQRLNQIKSAIDQDIQKGKELRTSEILPDLWQKAENLKKQSESSEQAEANESEVLRLLQDTLSHYQLANQKARVHHETFFAQENFQKEKTRTNFNPVNKNDEDIRKAVSNIKQTPGVLTKKSNKKTTIQSDDATNSAATLINRTGETAGEKPKHQEARVQDFRLTKTIPLSQISPTSLPLVASSNNLAQNIEVSRSIAELIPNRKIKVAIHTDEGKQHYKENEILSVKVRSDKDCYIAVLGHYIDGQTILLFPNEYNRNNFVTANSSVAVPGKNSQNFELYVHEPFGTDIVQVISCSDQGQLSNFLQKTLTDKKSIPNTPLTSSSQSTIKREVQRIKRAIGYRPKTTLTENKSGADQRDFEWGEMQLLIYTSPD